MLKEIKPEIFVITAKSLWSAVRPSVNIYVLAGAESLVFDAGYGTRKEVLAVKKNLDRIEKIMKSRGKSFNVTWILPSHSHYDHFSGASGLKKLTGAKIILTEKMQAILKSRQTFLDNYSYDYDDTESALPARIFMGITEWLYKKSVGMKFIKKADIILGEKQDAIIGCRKWELVSMPGHSDDHIGLYCENEGILLAGDNVLRSVITWLGPPDSDLKKYAATLEKILSLKNLKLILPSHGSPVINPVRRINAIIAHRKKRSLAVLKIISQSKNKGISLKGIQKKLYPRTNFITEFNSKGWITLVLEEFLKDGKIETKMLNKTVYYMPCH